MIPSRPSPDNSAPGTVPGGIIREQSPGTTSNQSIYHNIEAHPQYRRVCILYSELCKRYSWPSYTKKRHISVVLQLPLSTISAIILDNYGID